MLALLAICLIRHVVAAAAEDKAAGQGDQDHTQGMHNACTTHAHENRPGRMWPAGMVCFGGGIG
jgi:hypothetical protein